MEAGLRVVVCDNCFKNLLVQAGRFSQSVAMRWRPSFSTAAMLTLSRCTVAWLGFTSGMLSRPPIGKLRVKLERRGAAFGAILVRSSRGSIVERQSVIRKPFAINSGARAVFIGRPVLWARCRRNSRAIACLDPFWHCPGLCPQALNCRKVTLLAWQRA